MTTKLSEKLLSLLSNEPANRGDALEKLLASEPNKDAAARELAATLESMKDVGRAKCADDILDESQLEYFLNAAWLHRPLEAAAEACGDPEAKSRLLAWASTSALSVHGSIALGAEHDHCAIAYELARRAVLTQPNELTWDTYQRAAQGHPDGVIADLEDGGTWRTQKPAILKEAIGRAKEASDWWEEEPTEAFEALVKKIKTAGKPAKPRKISANKAVLALAKVDGEGRAEALEAWRTRQKDASDAAAEVDATLYGMSESARAAFLNAEGIRHPLREAGDASDDDSVKARLYAAASLSAGITGDTADTPYGHAAAAVLADPACKEAWEAYESAVATYPQGFVEDVGEFGEWPDLVEQGKLPREVVVRAIATARRAAEGGPGEWEEDELAELAAAEQRFASDE